MKTKSRNLIVVFLMALAFICGVFAITSLTVFANEPEAEIAEVTTFNELLNAVNSDKTHIKLMNDINNIVPDDELPTKHRLVFDGGKDYILDLNGNKLMVGNYANEFYTDNFSMIAVQNSSSLEIENGSLVFENWYTDHRTAKGVVFVSDDSILTATDVDMYNGYTGTVVYATEDAKVTLDGGDYTAMSGFAVYLEKQASLTLDGGVWIGTKMGDSTATVYLDGYGALYSESTGDLVVNNAYFNTGIQVHESQVGAFSTATHELVINGIKQTEDIYFSGAGNQFAAIEAGKDYYWYRNGYSRALYKIENPLFANAVRVISYEKKYSIDVQSGTATVGGDTTTEVGYGQTVTIVADPAENGMEFVRWDTSGVELADYYSTTTTFTMPAAPVYIAAYYGNESVKSVSVTMGNIIVGEKSYDTEITLDGSVKLEKVEWYENLIKMEENDIFKPGKAYELNILVYPPDEHKFGDTVTATVNGKQATVNADSGYAIINYTFDALAGNPFPVIYNTSTSKLGIGGLLELDTALMSSQSNEFKTAFDADTVTYQWYKEGEIIEGATDAVYNFTADDVGCRFFVTVTVGDKTAWGDTHTCNNYLYQIYLNASDFVAGGKAPQISSATPGVSIDAESLFICEGKGQPELDIQKTVLIPGKTYLVIGTLVQTGEANIPYEANVYVNDILMDDKVDGSCRFFYKFTVPGETDYPVYYKTNGAVGIGVTLTVDTQKMCDESGTFKNAYEAANPTYQTVFYQWYKNGEAIEGATDISYTVKSTDKNSYINCKVTLVDGKCGFGAQQVITNVITVFNVQMPYPKAGETRIENSDVSVDGATVSGIMWWPKETGTEMQGADTYVEGTLYEFYIMLSAKDTFVFADAADRTVYVYGEQATHNSGYAYMGEIVAIHSHQYNDEVWAFDEEGHWQPCIVLGCPNPNEDYVGYVFHWGGNATCHTAGTCGQCGAEYYAEHDFSVPDYQYVDEMKCATYCANCDEIGSWSYHTGGVSDCQHKAVCEICHSAYGKLGEHVAKAEWVSDGTYHWHECKNCEEQQLDKVACSGGTATCTEKAVCATCGEEYGNFAAHNYDIVNGYKEADGHANTCSCGAHDTPVAHTPDRTEATETDPIKCTVCDYVIAPVIEGENPVPTGLTASYNGTILAGNKLAINQLTVKLQYSDSSEMPCAGLCEYWYNGSKIDDPINYVFGVELIGTLTITVKYQGFETTFDVQVVGYEITFNANTGSGTMESVEYVGAYTLPTCAFTAPDGKQFKGWATSANGEVIDGTTYNVTANVEFFAIWEDIPVVKYDVTFNANGGTGTMSPVEYAGTYTLPTCAFTAPDGKQFKGWATSANGEVIDGTTYNVSANVELFAIWEDIPVVKYDVTFNANGGTGTMSPVEYAGTYTLPTCAFTAPDGKQFKGWSTSANGEVIDGATYNVTADVELFAIWEDIPHNHDYGTTWKSDANNHWKECECGDVSENAAHTDSDTNGKCDVCGADVPVAPPSHTHDYGTIWKTDANNHWKECECGDVSENAAHIDGNGDNKCDTCDYAMPTHDPEDPETTPPADNPPTDDDGGLGAGAIVGIVIGSVAGAGAGGFALFWFVIKKKSFADLIAVFKKK